jgi:hypothetical protein|tara:strand:+ start:131 stop:505 length:375 start_codon:yes stop_codon:yes gene_type:complete
MQYTVYETATGKVIGCGFSSTVTDLNLILKDEDQSLIEGTYPSDSFTIVDGVAIDGGDAPTIIDNVRSSRSDLLTQSDWTQFPDSPLTTAKKAEWVTYRQALRDIPEDYSSATSLDDVVWPTKP